MIQLVNNSLWSELPKIQSKLSSHEVSEIKRRKGERVPRTLCNWIT